MPCADRNIYKADRYKCRILPMDIDDVEQTVEIQHAQHWRAVLPLRKTAPGEVPMGGGRDAGRDRSPKTDKDSNGFEELGGGTVAFPHAATSLPPGEAIGNRRRRHEKKGLADPLRPEETLAPRDGLARIIVTKQYLPSIQLVACLLPMNMDSYRHEPS